MTNIRYRHVLWLSASTVVLLVIMGITVLFSRFQARRLADAFAEEQQRQLERAHGKSFTFEHAKTTLLFERRNNESCPMPLWECFYRPNLVVEVPFFCANKSCLTFSIRLSEVREKEVKMGQMESDVGH